MHNIKNIRENLNLFKKKFLDRNVNVNLENLLKFDKESRELIQKKEKLESEKKIISQKRDKDQFSRSKEISKKIEELSKIQNDLKKKN